MMRLDELLIRLHEKNLTDAEYDELLALLAADRAARARLVDTGYFIHAARKALLQAQQSDSAILDARALKARKPASRRRVDGQRANWLPLAAAACLAAAVGIAFALFSSGPATLPAIATLKPGTNTVLHRDGKDLNALREQPLYATDTVEVRSGGAAVLEYADQTRISLAAGVSAAFKAPESAAATAPAGKFVFVSRGELSASVARQPAGMPMLFQTPHATATVLGTQLKIAVNADASRLDVAEGRVNFAGHAAGKSVLVATGEFAIAAAGVELAARAINAPPATPAFTSPYAAWKNGPPKVETYFPIGAWLQDPPSAGEYKKAGFNLYIALWKGLDAEQLQQLNAAGMDVICDQNDFALHHKDAPRIVGWYSEPGEPDNAQNLGGNRGYGPPVPPEKILNHYHRYVQNDPTRPVFLNLGEGAAWDNYYGRGERSDHPEDYAEYTKGADIAAFHIYPLAHEGNEVAGQLWYVARGVDHLLQCTDGKKPVWAILECTRIETRKPTPDQVRAEAWMALIHGATGLIYHCHAWHPEENSHGLLDDPGMLAAVTALNGQIRSLAPVLNSPTVPNGAAVTTTSKDARVDCLVKQRDGATYVFAVGMRDSATTATITVRDLPANAHVEVLNENRSLELVNGRIVDQFKPYAVHLYRIH